jgi:hypothetical protein
MGIWHPFLLMRLLRLFGFGWSGIWMTSFYKRASFLFFLLALLILQISNPKFFLVMQFIIEPRKTSILQAAILLAFKDLAIRFSGRNSAPISLQPCKKSPWLNFFCRSL